MRGLSVVILFSLTCHCVGCGGEQTSSPESATPITQSPIAEMPAPAAPPPAADLFTIPVRPMVTEEQAGFPLYPGASVTQAIQVEGEEGTEVRYREVHLTTNNDFDKVATFYWELFPEAKATSQLDTTALKVLQLEWLADGNTETIIITRDQTGKTTIVLAHK